MKIITIRILAILTIVIFATVGLFAQKPVKIVSGLKGEVYDQFAHDIQNNTHVNLQVYPTGGSRENLNYLMTDSIQIAFAQYDVLKTDTANPSIKNYIKVFLPLYCEEIHLISLRGNSIQSISDLAGKKVGIGDANSGTHVTSLIVKSLLQIKWTNKEISFDHSIQALLKHEIDAFFYVGAAPSSFLSTLDVEIANKLKFVAIHDSQLLEIYEKRDIEAGTYSWSKNDVSTIGVRTLLLVNTHNIDTAMAQQIDILYNDLNDNLKGIQWNKFSHPKWSQVDFSNMDEINWPVYKKEYVSYELVVNIMAIIAAILSFIQIYFIINKLWKRKHEQVVAESISISAMFISIFINGFFA